MSSEPPDSRNVCTVWVTVPDLDEAERIGAKLVEEELAACANLVPGVVSLYRWDGAMQRDDEVLLVLKTTLGAAGPLTARVEALHSYDVPEVLVLAVHTGNESYLSWVRQQVER